MADEFGLGIVRCSLGERRGICRWRCRPRIRIGHVKDINKMYRITALQGTDLDKTYLCVREIARIPSSSPQDTHAPIPSCIPCSHLSPPYGVQCGKAGRPLLRRMETPLSLGAHVSCSHRQLWDAPSSCLNFCGGMRSCRREFCQWWLGIRIGNV